MFLDYVDFYTLANLERYCERNFCVHLDLRQSKCLGRQIVDLGPTFYVLYDKIVYIARQPVVLLRRQDTYRSIASRKVVNSALMRITKTHKTTPSKQIQKLRSLLQVAPRMRSYMAADTLPCSLPLIE